MSLEIMKMELTRFAPDFYLFIAAVDAMSVVAVVLGLLWSRGEPRKKLLRSVLLLVGAVLICFGSEVVLELFGMGWRCTPFNIMMFLCLALFTAMQLRGMYVLRHLENTPQAVRDSFVWLLVLIGIKLFLVCFYFQMGRWHDRLAPYNGEMIVCASNSDGGGSAAGYFYAHINSLIHGAEIPPQDSWGWWGPR